MRRLQPSRKIVLAIASSFQNKKLSEVGSVVDLVRRSSSVGKLVVHLGFKAKYCHKIFVHKEIQQRCKEIFYEVADAHGILITEIGFDKDHAHIVADIGLKSIPEVAKLLKGTSAKFLLREFPLLKQQYFWGSGLWSPIVYFDSVGRNLEDISSYVRNQGLPRNTPSL